jgi:hypothetical protein
MLPLSTPRQGNTLLVYGQSSKPVNWRNASRSAMDLQWQYARIFQTGVQARGWEPGWVFKVLGLKKSFSKFVAFGRFGASRKAQKAFWVEKKGVPVLPVHPELRSRTDPPNKISSSFRTMAGFKLKLGDARSL